MPASSRASPFPRPCEPLRAPVAELVACLAQLEETDPRAHAALAALEDLGPAAVAPLVAAFHRCAGADLRARHAEALLRCQAPGHDRVLEAFVRMLEDDPVRGASYLSEQGDRRALPDLSRALDRAALVPETDVDWFSNEDVVALASAIVRLGGELTVGQQAKLDEVLQRRDACWEAGLPFEDDDGEEHEGIRA
jgi:hypothetical protein